MRTMLVLAGLGLLVLLFTRVPAESCCMVPASYNGTISQSAQEAVLFHHKGREELIVKINYKISGETLPDRFAWVITVPSEPDAYAVADEALFAEVFDWANPLVSPPLQTRGSPTLGLAIDSRALYIGKPVRVGPYAIQPVRALGKNALTALNAWLHENGFPIEGPKHMEYFVKNQFTFLCVKFSPAAGRGTVEGEGGVPPLHLSFASDRPYYPLRFSSRQGVFDVNLYIFTREEFDYEHSSESLAQINWGAGDLRRNVLVAPNAFPTSLKDAYAKTRFKDATGNWYLNVIRTRHTNANNSIAKWTKDIFFTTRG